MRTTQTTDTVEITANSGRDGVEQVVPHADTATSSPLSTDTSGDLSPALSRRGFMARMGAASTAVASFGGLSLTGSAGSASAQEASAPSGRTALPGSRPVGGDGLIMRQREPENLEFVYSSLDSFITPNDRFYVRSHFATPKLDAAKWQLQVEGAVVQPFALTYDELIKMPSRTVQTTLECAGNGRVYLSPPARGVQWEMGAVSTTEWTGVPLNVLLARAGLKPGAVEVVLEGADSGEIKDPPRPAGPFHFSRSLPLSKAQQQDVLIAYKMNGAELPISHGFPARVIVPGWYGMASIKWLTRIVVVTQPFQGHFQTIDYAYWQKQDGLASRVPITTMLVKSLIARPTFREIIPAGSTYRIYGAAWAGESAVTKVEVSTDGGQIWEAARLQNLPVPYLWRFWDFNWHVPARAGHYSLMVRATDARGNTQPLTRDPDRDHYMINHVVPVEVEVK